MLQSRAVNQALELFHYIPNKSLAIVGMAIFDILGLYLAARIYLSKSARFLYILPFTAILELTGYFVRMLCSDFTDLGRYVAMTLFLLLSPNALALVNYKAVGEIIRLSNVQTDRFYLRPKFVTWFFFSSDVFTFFLQGAGGGLQSSPGTNSIGIAITLVGLSLQLVFFACFALITIHVHHNPKYNYHIDVQPNAKRNLIICLYITLVLLYIRSIYRVAEYATGYDGPIASTEWAFYVFDGLVIAFCFVTYGALFIGNYLPRHNATSGDFVAAKVSCDSEVNSMDTLNLVENGIEMNASGCRNKYASTQA